MLCLLKASCPLFNVESPPSFIFQDQNRNTDILVLCARFNDDICSRHFMYVRNLELLRHLFADAEVDVGIHLLDEMD